MEKFYKIWDIKLDWWDTDIDFIKNSNWKNNIFKKYYTEILDKVKDNPTFSLEDIKKYHKIQNNTKLFSNEILLKQSVTLLWNKINKFIIEILKLDEENIFEASDTKTKQKVIITNPKYIEWITFNEYLKNLEYKKTKEIKKLIIDNIDSNKLSYPINSWWFMLSQISTFNIKVTKIENWNMYLIITDIASKIKEIIKK